jgi:hypothetical protein
MNKGDKAGIKGKSFRYTQQLLPKTKGRRTDAHALARALRKQTDDFCQVIARRYQVSNVVDFQTRSPLPSTLDECKNRIEQERHELRRDIVMHCVSIGEWLIIAKGLCSKERVLWTTWLQDNWQWSDRHAQKYMNVARTVGQIDPKPASDQSVAEMWPSIDQEAVFLLCRSSTPSQVREEILQQGRTTGQHISKQAVKAKLATVEKIEPWPKAKLDTLKELRQSGKSVEECAEALGVSKGSVSGAIHQRLPELKTRTYYKASKAPAKKVPRQIQISPIAIDETDLVQFAMKLDPRLHKRGAQQLAHRFADFVKNKYHEEMKRSITHEVIQELLPTIKQLRAEGDKGNSFGYDPIKVSVLTQKVEKLFKEWEQ